jgi:hypothetical protein
VPLSVSDTGTFSWTGVQKRTADGPDIAVKPPKVGDIHPNLCAGSTTPQAGLETAVNRQLRIQGILLILG